jgi:hypothetical protein
MHSALIVDINDMRIVTDSADNLNLVTIVMVANNGTKLQTNLVSVISQYERLSR